MTKTDFCKQYFEKWGLCPAGIGVAMSKAQEFANDAADALLAAFLGAVDEKISLKHERAITRLRQRARALARAIYAARIEFLNDCATASQYEKQETNQDQ